MAQGDLYQMPQVFSQMGNTLWGKAARGGFDAKYGAQNRFARAADRAQKAGMAHAFDAVGKAHGEELAGTPGFLAAKSLGPGGLARLRGKTLRGGISRLASANYGLAADTARSVRDFVGQHEMLKEQERIEKEKNKGGSLFGDIAGRLGGAALGFATGGVPGAVAGGLGLPAPAKRGRSTVDDEMLYNF